MTKLYIDDPEEGLARETSHPNFVKHTSEDFYYDCTDDISPFGSDDGADVLAELEEWYQDGGKDKDLLKFVQMVIDEWDFTYCVPYILATPQERRAWLAENEMHARYLQAVCVAYVSTAFGQLKIKGAIHPPLVEKALQALECQLWCHLEDTTTDPDWDEDGFIKERLLEMQAVIQKMATNYTK